MSSPGQRMEVATVAPFQIEQSASKLMSIARQATGVDIVDTDIAERLEKLLSSLNTEAQLSRSGAAAFTARLHRLLCNRLRMLRDLEAHPEILEIEIRQPVFLSSAPRTGSTKLHKLLSAGGDFLHLRGWEVLTLGLRTGDRTEDPSPRIASSDAYSAWFNEHSPGAMAIHEYATHEPDEDSLIYEHCLYAPYLVAFAFIPSYAMWYVEHREFRHDLDFFHKALKYLQWQFHDGDDRRWVLKSPVYLGLEPFVAEAFPDAVFITTNRDPFAIMASAASLCSHYQVAHSEVNVDAFLGPMMLEGFGTAMQHHLAGRDANPHIDFLDIGWAELTEHSEKAVERIYAHIGLELSDAGRKAMRDWEDENQQHKHGMHRYELEHFGFTRNDVAGKFSGYIERFGDKF